MKELDVLLERYLEQRFDQAPEAERQAFMGLLQKEDPEILAWLLGQAVPPAELADVVARLQRHP
jgi:antitoxin CptB